MLFPESNRVVFQKNPLVEVICQLRFPTILEISSEDPADFQKKIRAEYPLYERDEGGISLPKEFMGILDRFTVRPAERLTHKFSTEDSARLISLNREFLAVTETQYERWDHFRKEICRAKAALEEIYSPAFYSRVGLRYRNIIDRDSLGLADKPWSSLLNSALSGVLGAEGIRDQVKEFHGETLIEISELPGGHVTLRFGLVRLASENRQVYQIDADFFTRERSAPDHVAETLDKFNRLAGNLFRWAITALLHEALKPEEIR
jgi:uncharacterized protein (TIGR04255 family)